MAEISRRLDSTTEDGLDPRLRTRILSSVTYNDVAPARVLKRARFATPYTVLLAGGVLAAVSLFYLLPRSNMDRSVAPQAKANAGAFAPGAAASAKTESSSNGPDLGKVPTGAVMGGRARQDSEAQSHPAARVYEQRTHAIRDSARSESSSPAAPAAATVGPNASMPQAGAGITRTPINEPSPLGFTDGHADKRAALSESNRMASQATGRAAPKSVSASQKARPSALLNRRARTQHPAQLQDRSARPAAVRPLAR